MINSFQDYFLYNMGKMIIRRILSLVVFVVLLSIVGVDSTNECVYTLYVRTGSIIKAGTNSIISATLGDAAGKSVWIPNLREWGLMGPKHDYFERGNLDIFTGLGPCIPDPICRLNLTSDGSGKHHSWYCNYVEITATGPHKSCSKSNFNVQQWLGKKVPPYKLTVLIDECRVENGAIKIRSPRKRPFVVKNKPLVVLSSST